MTPRYEEHDPDPALAAHVHCTWIFEGDEDGVEQAVPPDGRCELIAHLGRPYEELGGDGAWHAQAPIVFAGQLTRPLVLRSRGPVSVLGVRFKPAGAWAFVGAPLSSCTDLRVDFAALAGAADASTLGARLREATSAPERIAVLTGCVAARVAARATWRDDAVEACVERILASEGRVSLAELAVLAGVGERRLQRRFAEVVGIAPRTLGVIVRLRRVFAALRDAPWSTWSDRAQSAGFFDHPQMARDFRRLLGTAPSRWAARGPGLATSLADSAA
jgi:AraC-like DNA-binding protein